MKKPSSPILACLILVIIIANCYSQGVTISSTGASNDPSAIVEISCTNQGILLPRMTEAQRDAIKSPAEGLLLYNLTSKAFNFFDGTNWIEVQSDFVSATSGLASPGNGVGINTTGTQPHNSAILDVASTTKGVLLPRTTPASISDPADGLIIYNSSAKKLSYYNGLSWDAPCAISVTGSISAGSTDVDGIAINTNGALADQSAILDISSTDKGILLPGLTNAQRSDLLPTEGLLIYNTDTKLPEYWNGSGWYSMGPTSGNGFITEWRTTAVNETITLPLNNGNGAAFNCTVYWGDGTSSAITAYDDPDRIHTYSVTDDYQVEIVGTCEG